MFAYQNVEVTEMQRDPSNGDYKTQSSSLSTRNSAIIHNFQIFYLIYLKDRMAHYKWI